MKFHGIVKATVLDYPGLMACTLFTGGCNFRCPFCQNASLVEDPSSQPVLDLDDLDVFLKSRIGLLDGVCITGGEPLIQQDIGAYCSYLKELGFKVKVDTNGSIPSRLAELLAGGNVDYVAMDIKSSPEKYAQATGLESFDVKPILESVDLLKHSTVQHEFRTTLVRELHTEKDIDAIGLWLGRGQHYFLQTFEDKGRNIVSGLHGFTKKEEENFQIRLKNYMDFVELRGV
ncbi:MAG: anaerobic ribonucleoside-triphosphate reductase activating protein [Spirochaetia bacterium]|nr:anaerobic ribonucleoside-triphosphate reductase activating protein [Spirochaetia bacterium]